MIPENRIKRALLNVEKREVISDIAQIQSAILHLESGGINNYDAARESSCSRKEDYKETSDEILEGLESRLEERTSRLDSLEKELASLMDEDDL